MYVSFEVMTGHSGCPNLTDEQWGALHRCWPAIRCKL